MAGCLGIAELYCWIAHMPDRAWRTGHEVEDCLQAHLDHGINQVVWKIGRSVVDYHSELPRATLYSGEGHPQPYGREIGEVWRERCGLRTALEFAHSHEMTLYARLAMNRHYNKESYGGCFTSHWAAEHPEYYEYTKEGHPDPSRLCYACEEVREERVEILEEAARIGVDGLQLDFCRQPPMARYHPALVERFQKICGVDPRELDPWEGPGFRDWFVFRASFLTDMMRELRGRVSKIEAWTGQKIPLQVRVPDNGLDVALMAGLDLMTWCLDGLIDEISVSSLNWLADFQEHDLRPYVELGQATGVKVYGGVNALALQRTSGALPTAAQRSPLRLAERALAQYAAGAEGMTLYQSDYAVWPEDLHPVLPLLGDPQALQDFATDPDNRRRWPTTYLNQTYGLDNHSSPRGHYHVGGLTPGV